eukprot:CAMPEP_0184663768 /NCGR_PEP_ID=MMETSP0308-20130426/49677_1 /TAXON_ID=38269 /ORGANISM="Gloeochaete witrockiana, Strain SAG 46.84" /LENGTH=419 /DNA_ID=CAMNT_0027106739 /DNA_START=131 /DNA_END=1390 /DNA_ORIENTATION=-
MIDSEEKKSLLEQGSSFVHIEREEQISINIPEAANNNGRDTPTSVANAQPTSPVKTPRRLPRSESISRDSKGLLDLPLDDRPHRNKHVSEYYRMQAELLSAYRRIDAGLAPLSEVEDEEDLSGFSVKLAMRLSFLANILLFGAKVWTSIDSGSLSVLGSTIESLLDLVSSFILWASQRASQKRDKYKYPVGKERIELVGVLIFAAIMGTSSVQLVIVCVARLAEQRSDALDLSLSGELVLLATIVSKLGLWILCRTVGKSSGVAAVEAYAADHRNDVITNTIGTVCAYVGAHYLWYIDPVGAIAFSLYIIIDYVYMGKELMQHLVGMAADPKLLTMATYLAGSFDPLITHVDTVKGFHFGRRHVLEVDIVMAPETPLRDSHDVADALQQTLESWKSIAWAVVHVDYEFSHEPEHGGREK